MTVVVFCGPTIGPSEVARELNAVIRPPAQRGDILRAVFEKPNAIALIDGYFDRVPSVWHKEILWAMAQGVHVFGASSMGALRAAELAAFGMVGIGEIFEDFRAGRLEDDDEVAVAHGDAESGYRLTSEAMVNIRATLRAAERHGVIGRAARLALENRAKVLPYHRRELRNLLCVPDEDLAPAELAALRDWLPGGRVDQKRLDALAMLRHVAELDRRGFGPKKVDFVLAETEGWLTLCSQIDGRVDGGGDGRGDRAFDGGSGTRERRSIDPLLEDELRTHGMWRNVLSSAMARLLTTERLRQGRIELNARAIEAWIDDFRRERELLSAESFDAWLRASGLDERGQEAFFRREAGVRATRAELIRVLGTAVEDELRAAGRLSELRSVARAKAASLAEHGVSSPTLEDSGLTEAELWTWFFCERLRVEVPASLAAYAAGEGTTVDDLRCVALRDFLFRRLEEKAPPQAAHHHGHSP